MFRRQERSLAVSKSKENYGLIGPSKHLRLVRKQIKKAAALDRCVIIDGPTGTGKEPIAKAIHNHSKRKNGPFIAIDCATGNENLIDNVLFGHVYGAFTGALKNGHAGALERADKGTLFLDEIGNAARFTQDKLLRAIDEMEIWRLGSTSTKKLDVRVIAATNKNLRNEIRQGRFKDDLFYRLNKCRITTKALCKRPIDVICLFDYELIQKRKRDDLEKQPIAEEKLAAKKAQRDNQKIEIPAKQTGTSGTENRENLNLPKKNVSPSVVKENPDGKRSGKKRGNEQKPPKRARIPKLTSIKFLIYHHDLPGNVRELQNYTDKSFTEVRKEFKERKREIKEDISLAKRFSDEYFELRRRHRLMSKALRISKGRLTDEEMNLIRKVISKTEKKSKLKQTKLHNYLMDWCVKVYEIVRLVQETDLSNEEIAKIARTRRNVVVTPREFMNRFGIQFPSEAGGIQYDIEYPLDCLRIMKSL
jgi:transcriptional regulator with PAS, ATPase and Fis domain